MRSSVSIRTFRAVFWRPPTTVLLKPAAVLLTPPTTVAKLTSAELEQPPPTVVQLWEAVPPAWIAKHYGERTGVKLRNPHEVATAEQSHQVLVASADNGRGAHSAIACPARDGAGEGIGIVLPPSRHS